MSWVSGFPPLRLLPPPSARSSCTTASPGLSPERPTWGPPSGHQTWAGLDTFRGVRWEQKVHTPLLTLPTHSEVGTPSLS